MKGLRCHWLVLAVALLQAAASAHSQGQSVEAEAAVFSRHCAVCHQPEASGTPGFAPPLRGPHWARLSSRDDYVTRVLLFGLNGRIEVAGAEYNGVMPAFAAIGSEDIAAAINHLARLNGGTPTHTPQAVERLLQVPTSAKALRALRSELMKE